MTTISTPCPDTGAWRAWLDHELQVPALDRHLPDCPACQTVVGGLRDALAHADSALSGLASSRLPTPAETALAREQLAERRGARRPAAFRRQRKEPLPTVLAHVSTSWRVAASGLAAVLALSLVVALTPEGNSAAATFLAQFRSQQIAGIEVTPQTQAEMLKTLNALSNLGTLQQPPQPAPKTVSASEASQAIGFALQMPDPATLPAGLDKAPKVQVLPASQLRFTFDKTKARQYYQSTGEPGVTLPDRFDGTTLAVSIPSAALLQYGDPSTRDALLIGEAGELVVDVEGGKVSLPEMRDFLLGLPGLPEATVSQLRQIESWNQTLPIPVPVDKVNWQSTTFHGNQGLLLNDNSGVGSAAIWNSNGRLYGVAGSLRATDLKRIADSLEYPTDSSGRDRQSP